MAVGINLGSNSYIPNQFSILEGKLSVVQM